MLIPYPDQFPNEGLLLLLDKIRGKDVPLADLLHAGWCVQGYAMKQVMGGGPIVTGEPAGWTDEQVLQAALDSGKDEAKGVGLIPWVLVARIALKLALNLL